MGSELEWVPELPPGLERAPEGWEFQPLGKLVDDGRGISYGIVQPGPHDERGVPIVRVNNIVDGRLSPTDVLRVSPVIESKYRRTRLRGSEVLLTVVGAYFGESAAVPREFAGWNVARALAVIPVAESIDPYWVCACLRSPLVQHYMQTWATTTAQPTLNLRDVARLPIPLPSRREREGLAHVLGTLDDEIEVNLRMNGTLDGLAQTIFKSWFADATQAGFRKGWRESTIGTELTTLLGGTPSRAEPSYWEGGGIPWINSGKANEFRVTEPSECITKAGLENSSTKLLPERTTIIAITGATLGQVSLLEIEACANQSIVGVPGSERIPSEFVYFWVKENIEDLVSWQTGGAQQHINKDNVNALRIVCPPEDVMRAYLGAVRPLFDLIKSNCFESRTLAALRDALLPKLLSGQLRVPAAVNLVDAHT